MRIAVNTRLLLKNKLEGIGWFTYEILNRMVKAHPEDEFYFFFDRPYDEEFVFADNVIPIHLFPPARHPILFIWWFEWSAARALKKYKIDVFLSTDNFLSLGTSVPSVLITHDIAHRHFPDQIPFLERMYYDYFIPKYHQKADKVVAVSNFTKQDIIKAYQIEESKIEVAGNGSRKEFIPLNEQEKQQIRQRFSNGEEYFFYVGAIHPRKNVPRLIEAYDYFKQKTKAPTKLLLAGRMAWQTGAVHEAYQKAISKEDIIFLGYLSNEDLPKVTAAALASTYVSIFEGFGIPILEAMQCETPVITSNITSMPEVAGDAALLVDPYEIKDIADAMEKIFQSKDLRLDLIEKGKNRLKSYSWEKSAKTIYNTLKEVSE